MRNKKLSRRDFLNLSVGAAAGSLLAACGAQPTPETVVEKVVETVVVEKEGEMVVQTVEVEKEVVVTATPPPAEAVALLMWYQAENHKPEYDRRKSELEDTFDITLTYELLARETMTKKFPTTLMAGSGYPDIIEQNAEDIVKFMKGSDADIPMVALNDVLAASPYDGQVLQSRFDRYTKEGKIYGAPHDVHPILLLYHDAGWKELGVDLETVKTWDDYIAACEAVGAEATMADGRPRYAVMEATYSGGVATLMLQNGVWWTDENEEPMITAPGWKTAFETWFRMDPYRVDIDWGNQVAMFKEGQFLSEFTPDWMYGIHQQGTAEDADFVANSPMRLKFVPDGPDAGSWGGTSGSVVKQSSNVEKAVQVLLYLYFENGDGQMAQRFKDIGILPPVPSSWGDEVFKEEIPYLGGQVGGELFIEAAKALPSYHENWKTPLVSSAWSEQLALVVGGELTLDEAIALADENARAEIEKNI